MLWSNCYQDLISGYEKQPTKLKRISVLNHKGFGVARTAAILLVNTFSVKVDVGGISVSTDHSKRIGLSVIYNFGD